jgi:hypothetical protein
MHQIRSFCGKGGDGRAYRAVLGHCQLWVRQRDVKIEADGAHPNRSA